MGNEAKTIDNLQETIDELRAENTELRQRVDWLMEQLKVSKRQQFGQSSEQSSEQLYLDNIFNEAEDQADPSQSEPTYEEIAYKRKKRTGKREEYLSGLPVERIVHELPESERACPECGDTMRDIGVTVRDELKIIPAQVIHVEHEIHAYGCANCEKNSDHTPIIKAEAPTPLISGSLASPSAVAHIATQKYVNGVPLYRTEKGLSYDGVVLSRQTMANWIVYCAQNYLLVFYLLLIKVLLKENLCHADETTVQVLREPGREATTKSYEWLYRTGRYAPHQVVIYEYQETRSQTHPQTFLKDYKGYLCTDGYQAYHNLPPDIIVVGCWSHYLGSIFI